MAAKTSTYRPVANREMHAAMLELRRSSAASRHADSRTKRARSRQAARSRAIADFA